MIKKIEVFSAGWPLCEETIKAVQELPCESCEVSIHDLNQDDGARRAKKLGVKRVPAVAVNGKLLSGCDAEKTDLTKTETCCDG